jgi:hypothetical protein
MTDSTEKHEADRSADVPPGTEEDKGFPSLEPTSGPERLVEGLESSLRDPIKPIVYIPEEERFPPLEHPPLTEDEGDAPAAPVPAPTPPTRHRLQGGDWRHNLIALVFMLLTIALCGYFVAFWQDPYAAWNPLARPTPYVLVTWTPDMREVVNLAGTQTAEAIPTEAPVTLVDTPVQATPQGAATVTSAPLMMPFTLAEPGVLYVPNANGRGCNWASIGGSVTGLQGEALNNYAIQIIDAQEPDRLNVQVYSGAAATFGEGGFELYLGGSPREGQYIIQLLSQTGVPLSDEFLIFTRNACAENVTVVNFVQILDY